jgi:hypothetical protein
LELVLQRQKWTSLMRHRANLLVFFIVLQLCFAARSLALTPLQVQLRTEHHRVLNALNARGDKGELSELDDARFPGLFKQGWALAGDWAADYLDHHQSPTAKDLAHIFDGFAPPPHGVKSKYGDFLEYTEYYFDGRAVRIAPSVYVVQASYGVWFRTGSFMVLARNDKGHFEALWNVKDVAKQHYSQRDEIGRWAYLTRQAYYSGPLDVAKVLPVQKAATGHIRFLVVGHQGANGGTQLEQLSIWEWNGATAVPLLIEPYWYAIGYGRLSFDGRTITIHEKESVGMAASCGSCPEPGCVWKVRISPTGVENLGHRFLKPEYQWADELFSKVERGESTAGMAAEPVRAAIESKVQELKTDNADSASDDLYWGMLDGCRVLSRGPRGAFIVSLDELDIRLEYNLRQGRPYFTKVKFG